MIERHGDIGRSGAVDRTAGTVRHQAGRRQRGPRHHGRRRARRHRVRHLQRRPLTAGRPDLSSRDDPLRAVFAGADSPIGRSSSSGSCRHGVFEKVAVGGTPDVRIVLYRCVPVMAMVRLPTRESRGRANLHQGAVGAGVHLRTGRTYGGVCKAAPSPSIPTPARPSPGWKSPCWDGCSPPRHGSGRRAGTGLPGRRFRPGRRRSGRSCWRPTPGRDWTSRWPIAAGCAAPGFHRRPAARSPFAPAAARADRHPGRNALIFGLAGDWSGPCCAWCPRPHGVALANQSLTENMDLSPSGRAMR